MADTLKRVLVIGDLNVDVIVSGLDRLPELDHEVLCEDIRVVMGGSASIFACRLAQLGGRVDFLGKLGGDANGRIVLESLRRSGVGTGNVDVVDGLRTGVTIVLVHSGSKANVTYLGCIDALTPADIEFSLLRGYDHLHISSIYLQRKLLGSVAEVFREAKARGLTTSLDPGTDPFEGYDYIKDILGHVDIFLPNEWEAKGVTGSAEADLALEELGSMVPTVVIKLGREGAIGKSGGRVVRMDPVEIRPVDTTGAGDSFDAGFIYYFVCEGRGIEASMRFANALGALSCLYLGGAEERIAEADVLRFLRERSPDTEGSRW